jgi:desampylase
VSTDETGAADVRLAATAWNTIRTLAERTAPDECCGLLIGAGDDVTAAWPAQNIAASPQVRYEVDPRDHVAAVRHARAQGLSVVGAFHSHPRTAPLPSPTDRAEALTSFLYLIAGREPGAPWCAGAFVFIDGNFVERRLVFEA